MMTVRQSFELVFRRVLADRARLPFAQDEVRLLRDIINSIRVHQDEAAALDELKQLRQEQDN